MKTVLDLVGEFAVLNDAKVMWGGKLPGDAEKRWEELKRFYDLLMSQSGLSARPVSRRFSAQDIKQKVTARDRLRVPVESEMIIRAGGDFHVGVGVNISRGGLYLSTPMVFPVSTILTVFLASPDVKHESLLEAQGEVAWVTKSGDRRGWPPGMGISFKGRRELLEKHLDALVIDALVRHLSGVDANGLAPEFLIKEEVEL